MRLFVSAQKTNLCGRCWLVYRRSRSNASVHPVEQGDIASGHTLRVPLGGMHSVEEPVRPSHLEVVFGVFLVVTDTYADRSWYARTVDRIGPVGTGDTVLLQLTDTGGAFFREVVYC
jgi:hypothetical protein